MNLDSKNARKQLAALKIMDKEIHSEQLGPPHPKLPLCILRMQLTGAYAPIRRSADLRQSGMCQKKI